MSLQSDSEYQYVALLRPLTEAALADASLRDDLLPLIQLGKTAQKSALPVLRDRMVRLAFFTQKTGLKTLLFDTIRHSDFELQRREWIREAFNTEDPEHRRMLLARVTKIAAYSSWFRKWVDNRRFTHPETQNKDKFDSLPPPMQQQIYEQWKIGKKQWAQDFKPEGLDDATKLTPAKYDALEKGDKFWVSWSPKHLHEMVGKGKTSKGTPYIEARLVDRHTGELVDPGGKPRKIWRSSTVKDEHEFHHVPKDHEVSAIPEGAGKDGIKIDWEHELSGESEEAKASVVPTPKKKKKDPGEHLHHVSDLKVGDYFTMEKDGKTHLMQVVNTPGTDHIQAAPVHVETGITMGGTPISVSNEDLGVGTYMPAKTPKPRGGQSVNQTGQLSTGDYMTFGGGSHGPKLMKVVDHSGEYLHAVPIDPETGEQMGDAEVIDAKGLKDGKSFKVPSPAFTAHAKPKEKEQTPSLSVFDPHPKDISLEDVSDFLEESPEKTDPLTEKVEEEVEDVVFASPGHHHSENIRDWNGSKKGLNKILKDMKQEAGDHASHPDWMHFALLHLKQSLLKSADGAKNNGMQSVQKHYQNLASSLHKYQDGLLAKHEKGPQPKKPKKPKKPKPESDETPKEPKTLADALKFTPDQEKKTEPKAPKPKVPEHKPTGKHKDRKELRGAPHKKLEDKSDMGKHHFMHALLAPEGMPEELRTQAKEQLNKATYKDIGTILRNIQHMRKMPEDEHTQELRESGYTDENLAHLEHVLKKHMHDVDGRLYHPDVLKIANIHDLEGEDADELRAWRNHAPYQGKKLTPTELFSRFLKHAKPETKLRMQGMPLNDFMAMYNAIMAEEDEEEEVKTAALLRKMASYYGVSELSPQMRSLVR